MAIETKELIDLSGETDATVWAREFCRLHGMQNKFELLRAWFANAIEAGRDAGYRQAVKEYPEAFTQESVGNPGGTD